MSSVTTRTSQTVQPILVSKPTPRGLFAKWEIVNGKLTCVWLKHPD